MSGENRALAVVVALFLLTVGMVYLSYPRCACTVTPGVAPIPPVVRYDSLWPGVGNESVVAQSEDGWIVLRVVRDGGVAGEIVRFNAAERVFTMGPAPANWKGHGR